MIIFQNRKNVQRKKETKLYYALPLRLLCIIGSLSEYLKKYLAFEGMVAACLAVDHIFKQQQTVRQERKRVCITRCNLLWRFSTRGNVSHANVWSFIKQTPLFFNITKLPRRAHVPFWNIIIGYMHNLQKQEWWKVVQDFN